MPTYRRVVGATPRIPAPVLPRSASRRELFQAKLNYLRRIAQENPHLEHPDDPYNRPCPTCNKPRYFTPPGMEVPHTDREHFLLKNYMLPSEYASELKPIIHRGLYVPKKELPEVSQPGVVEFFRKAGLGRHWSENPDAADFFALNFLRQVPNERLPEFVPIRMTAKTPGISGIEGDPYALMALNILDRKHPEREVTIIPETPLQIHRLQYGTDLVMPKEDWMRQNWPVEVNWHGAEFDENGPVLQADGSDR